jgi:hypothetical protein
MAKSDDRMQLIAAALNGILACGIKNYNDHTLQLDSAERIAAFAIRLADTTLEMAYERKPKAND